MINNINKNSYNMNPYNTDTIKPNNETKQTQNSFNEIENSDFLNKIKEQIKDAELIAIKMIKGERLTSKEQGFITEKYPDLKQLAEQSLKESKDLKEQLKNLNTDEERTEILSKAVSDLKTMAKKGLLSEVQVKIKMSSLEEVEKFLKTSKLENKKAELIATKMVKGEKLTTKEQQFINEKYPDIKQLVEQSLKESKGLKEQLKNFKTDEERTEVLSKAISDIKTMAKKGVLSETQVKIKLSSLEEVEKFIKTSKLENKKAELIAVKIVKGEKLTTKEQQFINEKYPEIKELAEKSLKETKDLKGQLKNLKTDEEKNQLLSKEISDIEVMAKKGLISEFQFKIKMLSIEKIKKDNEKDKESIFNINPYIFANLEYSLGNLTGVLIFIVVIIAFLYII
ncbi:30S ribosomal protein S20 [[Clostridium] dakarense]|uniref:30S ribosomal protein S20 n=1 Tax=Faecalimicrobium dakarense TaxID=1301100 RepID=UPI0004B399C5|nr:30S ribosomal protein S20 [[Clostridium] dakarense]